MTGQRSGSGHQALTTKATDTAKINKFQSVPKLIVAWRYASDVREECGSGEIIESRFTLDFHDRHIHVYRLPGPKFAPYCLREHDRYGGGSVIVWAAIYGMVWTQ